MIEASDINDNAILNATTQRTDARGFTQFLIRLESGRIVCSEYIPEDHKREALRKWIETVREQVVADATARRIVKAKPSTLATTGTELPSASSIQNSGTAVVASPTSNYDPLLLAKSQLERLDSLITLLDTEIGERTVKLQQTQIERARWAKVINVLEEIA